MALQRQTQKDNKVEDNNLKEDDLDILLAKKEVITTTPRGFWSRLFKPEPKIIDIHLTEQDKKIVFLLNNNLLVKVAQVEECGYVLKENHKKEYNQRLYQSILKDPEETLREYLKNDLELPTQFLAVSFLVEMQTKKYHTWVSFNKKVTSFIDKVMKGLDNDPIAKYKYEKINDKDFVNELYDIWFNLGMKHLKDIETKVINKKKGWFFTYRKSQQKIESDLKEFMDKDYQHHIYNAEGYFSLPFKTTFFAQHLSMDKILKAKDLIRKHEEVRQGFSHMADSRQARILEQSEIKSIIEAIEGKVREYYQQEHSEIVEDIKSSLDKKYLQKVVSRNMIKGIDDKLMNDLPVETLKIINEIKSIISDLYQKDLNEETKEMINFLWQEKMPEIIKKYLEIDSPYRESLKNVQGKNAKELMTSSLEMIEESLKHIEKDINEENLKSLSINTRYLKNKLKSGS